MPPRVVRNRSQQKEQTAGRILAAAREMFAERGFDDTTTRAIAERAGVATGTVFAHYPDKNVLLAKCLHENIAQVLDETYANIPAAPASGLVDQLVFLSAGLVSFYIANDRLSRELIKHATFQFGEEATAFNRQMGRFVGHCSALLENASARGELPPDVDAAGMARCYLAFHFFVVNGCLRDPRPEPGFWLGQLRDLVTTLLDGYRRPE